MAFNITYKKLFEVEFRQNYHLNDGELEFAERSAEEQDQALDAYRQVYDLQGEFVLFPTAESQRVMAGLGLLFKPTTTGFFVAGEVEEVAPDTYALKRTPTRDFTLRFALGLRASAFANYTNLSLYGGAQQLYYFSNLPSQADTTRTFPFLSLIPPAFQTGGVEYKAGDLIRRTLTATELHLALRTGAHSRPPAGASNDNWKLLAGQGYVNANDRLTLYPLVFTFQFPPDTIVAAAFAVVAPDGTAYDGGEAEAPPGQTLRDHRLDLLGLASGRYRLEVEGEDTAGDPYTHSEEIYLDPRLPQQRIFSLIEICHRAGTELGAYRLLDDDHQLLQPFYQVDWLNRYTFWRYLFRQVPDPVPDPGEFDEIDERQYVRRSSLPLTKSFIAISYDVDELLPNPMANTIKPEGDRVYSDVFVHN